MLRHPGGDLGAAEAQVRGGGARRGWTAPTSAMARLRTEDGNRAGDALAQRLGGER